MSLLDFKSPTKKYATRCLFNWIPPKFSKYKKPCKLAHNFLLMPDIVKGFVLKEFRGAPVKKTPCISSYSPTKTCATIS